MDRGVVNSCASKVPNVSTRKKSQRVGIQQITYAGIENMLFSGSLVNAWGLFF